jgi:hypothetical protein
MDTTGVICFFIFVIVWALLPYLKYVFKLWVYFKMHEAHNTKAVTRVNRKPRKPARPTIR